MNILVFDTCLDKMYVALAKDNEIIDSKIIENHDNKYHSAFLISTIKNILKTNGLTPQNIDVIGTDIGPGSFTGIRACTTVARIFAQQLNIKAVGVSSLEILSKINPTDKKSIVALDARKNCAYLYNDGEIQGAVQLDKVKNMANSDDCYVITDDKLLPLIGGTSYQAKNFDLGRILAELVYKKLQNPDTKTDWQSLKPLYIQPPPMG